jgi:hypothetical protein
LQLGDIEKARVTEIVARLSDVISSRTGDTYDAAESWPTNAQRENARKPFRLVLDRANFLAEVNDPAGAWDVPRSAVVPRTPAGIAGALSPMLFAARKILIIDPWFNARRGAYVNTLREILREAVSGRLGQYSLDVELHTKADIRWDLFEADCQVLLPRVTPTSITLKIRRWIEVQPGEQFHNRYVLTNIGGVMLGAGLDAPGGNVTDDVSILSRDDYARRWGDFGGGGDAGALAFRAENQLSITGSRAIAP